jgi:hypothetical protein
MIMCGLALGQYFSQYDIRQITSGYSVTKSPQIDGEFLLGYNDAYASEQLRYNFTQWDHSTMNTKLFLLWLKKEVMLGHLDPIMIPSPSRSPPHRITNLLRSKMAPILDQHPAPSH